MAALVTLVTGVVEGAIFTLAATLPYIITFAISGMGDATPPSSRMGGGGCRRVK